VFQVRKRSRRGWQSEASRTIRSLPVCFFTQALIAPTCGLSDPPEAEAKAPPPTASASTALAVASEVVLVVAATTLVVVCTTPARDRASTYLDVRPGHTIDPPS